jgi:small-conductance mechanosensitive channel
MKILLNALGLNDIPYLLEAAQVAWHLILVLLFSWVVWRVCFRLIDHLHDRVARRSDSADESKRVQTMTQVFRYVVGVLLVVITVMLVLGELGISVAPLLATAGVAGLAVGFGVQSLVKDYFTGFVLLMENQIRKGDVITAGGKSGFVEEVTLRYVRLRDYDGAVHFVPNGTITSVSNMSMEFAYAVIDIGIAYRSDIDRACAVMRETAARLRADPEFSKRILDELEIAGVESLAESSVILRARFKVSPLEQWSVRREYLRRLKYAFDEQGIEIPYPHLTINAGEAGERSGIPVHWAGGEQGR